METEKRKTSLKPRIHNWFCRYTDREASSFPLSFIHPSLKAKGEVLGTKVWEREWSDMWVSPLDKVKPGWRNLFTSTFSSSLVSFTRLTIRCQNWKTSNWQAPKLFPFWGALGLHWNVRRHTPGEREIALRGDGYYEVSGTRCVSYLLAACLDIYCPHLFAIVSIGFPIIPVVISLGISSKDGGVLQNYTNPNL